MTRLSACYFCGTALDESLDDYPVVPEPLRAGDTDRTTVTLCPSCHEKLDAVLERVTDAVESAGTAPTDDTSPGVSTSPPDADPDDVLVEPEPTVSRDGPIVDDPEPTDDTDPGTADNPGPDSAQDPSPEPEAASDTGSETSSDSAASSPGQADENDAEPANDENDGERSVVEGKHDISALEYNKVMRLLQNREFPVDREEIEMVAANAYQVARADCEQVIDVAIDRGLIVEVDGQLRKPENA